MNKSRNGINEIHQLSINESIIQSMNCIYLFLDSLMSSGEKRVLDSDSELEFLLIHQGVLSAWTIC
jgi:hypothetical protein